MTKPELFEELERLLMEHDFLSDKNDDFEAVNNSVNERLAIRAHLRTCGTIDPEKMTDVINTVADARDLGAEYTWVLRWRVR
jgi:hypothetical protein